MRGRLWIILSPVLTAALKVSSRSFLDFYTAATPLIFCAATDDHLIGFGLKQERQYKDYLSWGLSLEGGAGFAFAPAALTVITIKGFACRRKDGGAMLSRWRS